MKLLVLTIACVAGGMLAAGVGLARTRSAQPPAHLRVIAQPGVPSATIELVEGELARVRPLIDADFGVHDRPLLIVRLYTTHAAFARALHRLEGVWPEGAEDTSGNIVHGFLPVGPPTAVLPHNLSHVYTEWVMDRLTGNSNDRQPNPAWLYDGIAEWEADRRSASVPCSMHGSYPLALSSLASPSAWWATRAGIFGGLEYCEAKVAASRLIAREGWGRIVHLLHSTHSWDRFIKAILVT